MAQVIASLVAKIGADISGFVKGAGSVKGGLADMAKQYLSTAAVVTAFGSAVAYSIESAAEAQRVDAQLGAVLQSTGGAAGIARAELEELASSLSRVSTYDDEAIKSSEALLLTFTKVGSEAFPQATQAILDMSTAMGTDLQGATIQVGKALNDPIKGITALSRVGVSFTDEQKKMIATLVETGDTLGAQKIILDELSKEFGGSALAASKTYTGQIKILKNEVGNLSEAFGSKLVPVLSDVVGGMADFISIQNDANKLMESGENTYRRAAIAQATIDEVNRRNKQSTEDVTGAQVNQAGVLDDILVPSLEDTTKAIEEFQKANAGMIDGAIDITSRNKDFAASQQEILDNIAITREEGEKLYPWEAEKITENQEKLDELGQAYFDNLEDFKAAMQEKFTLYAIEQIAMSDGVAGFSAAEYEKARVILETTDVATAAAFEEQQAMAMLAQAVSDGTLPVQEWGGVLDSVMADGVASVSEVQAAIEAVPKENAITFTISTIGAPPNLDVSTDAAVAPKGTHRAAHAIGGSFVIPSNYGTEGFSLGGGDTASGGEGIKITPRGKSGNEDVIAAIERNRLSEERLAQLFEGAMLRMRQ